MLGNRKFGLSEGISCLEYSCHVLFARNLSSPPPPPPPPTKVVNFACWPQPISYQQPPLPPPLLRPHLNWPVMCGHTSAGKPPGKSGCTGCICTLLAGNSSISLARSEEQIHFSHQSLKMLKMASESFIQASLLFLGLFLKISCWVPLIDLASQR